MTTTTQALSGQVAVVTGAGRGIGRAIACAYAQAGAAVCCAARTLQEVAMTVCAIEASGRRAIAVPTDVTQLASVQQMLQTTVETFGGLDTLVINAGGDYDRRHVAESCPEGWRATLEVNLLGAYYCAHAAIGYLKQRDAGKIIAVCAGIR